jgi:hypothetical protein
MSVQSTVHHCTIVHDAPGHCIARAHNVTANQCRKVLIIGNDEAAAKYRANVTTCKTVETQAQTRKRQNKVTNLITHTNRTEGSNYILYTVEIAPHGGLLA